MPFHYDGYLMCTSYLQWDISFIIMSPYRKIPINQIQLKKISQMPPLPKATQPIIVETTRLYLVSLAKKEAQDCSRSPPFTFSTLYAPSKCFLDDKPPNIDLKSIPGYRRPRKYDTSYNVFESILSEGTKRPGKLF